MAPPCLLLRFTVAGIGDVRCEMNAALAGRWPAGKSAPGLKRENCDSDLLPEQRGRYGGTAFRRLIPDLGQRKEE